MIATDIRNKTTRIMTPSLLAESERGLRGEHPCGGERGLARLRLLDPGLGRSARSFRQFAELAERNADIGMGGRDLDARQHRRSIIAGRRVDRPDAHELSGIG